MIALADVRRLGWRVVVSEARRRLWSSAEEFELVCDLATRPPVPDAKVPVTMAPETGSFDGFARALAETRGLDYGQLLRRQLAVEAGIPGLHVACAEGGDLLYAQWLLGPQERDRLAAAASGPWRSLAPDEAMVEYAYAFPSSRGLGVMAAGMGQLLEKAAVDGSARVFTYVRTDNVPSLRGCARVGFVPDAVVERRWRLGRRTFHPRPLHDDDRSTWAAATAKRS